MKKLMKKNNWLWFIGGTLIIAYALLRFTGEKFPVMNHVSSAMYYVGIAMELTAILLAKGKDNIIAYISGCFTLAVLIVLYTLPFSALVYSIRLFVLMVTLLTLAIIAKKMYKEYKWVQALGIAFIIVFAVGFGMALIGNMLFHAIGNQNAIDFINGFVIVTGTADKLLAGAMFFFIGRINK